MKSLNREAIAGMKASLSRQKAASFSGGYVVFIHPSTHEAMCRADAREHWYAQHRANRIAKRNGAEPQQIQRQFTASTGEFSGVRLVIDGRIA